MQTPAQNSLAIVGAGPIGLETALAAIDLGFDVHVFEQGEVGSHPIAWGQVRLFTPWRMNVGPVSRKYLDKAGWKAPAPDAYASGLEYAESYLQPIAKLAALKGRVHTHSQVVHIGRHGFVKRDAGKDRRAAAPFRLLIRDQGGRENYLHAFALIDASGVYGQPGWAGNGGIPARQELYLAPQMSYHLDDVCGLRRGHYAGKRTMVIGAGASAATTITELVKLAGEAEGSAAVWVTRKPAAELYAPIANDPLPERAALYARAREIARGGHAAVTHIGGALIEGFEYNSATHRYRVALETAEGPRLEEVDRVIVNVGFGPDNTIYRELQIHECYESRGPMKLSAALQGSGASDCIDTPAFGVDALANPEPNFYVLGNKSYGKNSNFLLETGFKQVGVVVAKLAEALQPQAVK